MTITVSISEFRQNIAEYLNQVESGHTILLKDNKRGKTVAQVLRKKTFDPQSFGRTLKAAAGVFTAEQHPEWRTKQDVIRWVQEGRKKAERAF